MAMVVVQKDEADPVHSTILSRMIEAVRWRSWLSHLSNTQKVPGSNPGRTILVALTFAVTDCNFRCVPPATMLPWLLVGAFLGHAILSSCAASLGERAFPTLSSSALAGLANMRDASKNLDASDYYSHLQKILIPRPGTYTIRAWFANPLLTVQPTLKTTPLFEITSFQRSASSIGT
jgi:hypothetical protein